MFIDVYNIFFYFFNLNLNLIFRIVICNVFNRLDLCVVVVAFYAAVATVAFNLLRVGTSGW